MDNNNFLELVDIVSVDITDGYDNMVDISVDGDESFCLSNGIISHNSARNLAVAGFSVIGRDNFGAYPLKGKPLNVRDVAMKKIKDNKEITEIIQILGLEFGKKYNNLDELRYGKVVIMSDADCLIEDTKVKTLDGVKMIKDLTYFDKVLTHSGKYMEINNIIESNKEEYVNIKLNGIEIKTGLNHKMLIYRDGGVLEISACDLLPTDFLLRKK